MTFFCCAYCSNGCTQKFKVIKHGLSTVVIVIWAPFTCGNHYILSAGLKKKKTGLLRVGDLRENPLRDLVSQRAPSVFAQRGFVIVGPQALSAPPPTLSLSLCGTQVQPKADQEHTGVRVCYLCR